MKNSKQRTTLILGGDGYLGWSLGLAFANRTDHKIVLADNLIKRQWEKDVNAKLLVPTKKPAARIAEYKRTFGKDNLFFEKLDLLDQKAVEKILRKHRPQTVFNCAQQPSAPFSMKSPKHSALTFSNNLIGHLNLLWAIARVDKHITCIKLGSAGCYGGIDTSYLPLGRKDFSFEHKGQTHKLLDMFMPMQATDFYHQSKISDFLLDDLCAKIWNLKIISVQQSTIFGATIEENHAPERVGLSARFNYDSAFGTVMNRFICQTVIGHPMTIYGDGKVKTGLISLSDTIENFMRLAELDIKPGSHQVVHNYTHRLSIEEIAQKIVKIEPSAQVQHIANPRQEGAGKLDREVEIHRAIKPQHRRKNEQLDIELARMLEFTKRHARRIDHSIFMPTVQWTVNETNRPGRVFRYSLPRPDAWQKAISRALRSRQPQYDLEAAEEI